MYTIAQISTKFSKKSVHLKSERAGKDPSRCPLKEKHFLFIYAKNEFCENFKKYFRLENRKIEKMTLWCKKTQNILSKPSREIPEGGP